MSIETRTSRRDRLEERRAAMPIIDVARVPWHALHKRWPRRAPGIFLWLRVIRPVAVALFWLLLLRYAWMQLFGSPDDLPLWQQAALYGVGILLILALMLALAPLRRREVRAEPSGQTEPASLYEMSEFSNFGELELGELQLEQRLVIHHDEHGVPDRAETATHAR